MRWVVDMFSKTTWQDIEEIRKLAKDIQSKCKYKITLKEDVNIDVNDLRDGSEKISFQEFCKMIRVA